MLQQQPPMGGPEGPGGLPPGGMPPQDVGGGMLPEQVLEEPPMAEMDGRMGGMAPPMMPG
jgi:hypothetical protein